MVIMMKAVKRIRSFGYQELTFAAFDDALAMVKRLAYKATNRRNNAWRTSGRIYRQNPG
jgi:hypothetical protein